MCLHTNQLKSCHFRTALHEAVGFCRKDVVQYLLKKGADINAKTSSGETPADIAQRLGFSADELGIYFGMQIWAFDWQIHIAETLSHELMFYFTLTCIFRTAN